MVENTNYSVVALKNRIVLDSSIILGWLLIDERTDNLAILFNSILDQSIEIIAPTLLPYEVVNALRSAIVRKRLLLNNAQKLTSKFEQLHCQLLPNQNLDTLVRLANDLEISAYDAAYVALAKKLNAPLYTLDEKLHKKVNHYIQCVVIH